MKIMNLFVLTLCLFATTLHAKEAAPEITPWQNYAADLMPIGDRMAALMDDPNDPQMRLEMYRMIYMGVSSAYMAMHYGDAENPSFWPIWNPAFNWFAPNPDDSYYVAHIDAGGVYKISGDRGSVKLVDFTIGTDSFISRGEGHLKPYAASYNIDSLDIAEDNSFEVILSAKRPKGYKGNWWKLDKKAEHLLVRQVAVDWLNEVDGRFFIDRLDRPANKPRKTVAELEADLRQIPVFVENWMEFSFGWLARIRQQDLVNKLVVKNLVSVNIGGGKPQQYIEGLFEFEEDEALIYETNVPEECLYWNIEITNMLWSTIDYANRQSHLNNHTASIDSDGKFRAVVSVTDPGVPNWLDSGGYTKGEFFGRWTACDSDPVPSVTKVKLKDLRKHLPADTAVVGLAQRDEATRLRKKGAQMRRKW